MRESARWRQRKAYSSMMPRTESLSWWSRPRTAFCWSPQQAARTPRDQIYCPPWVRQKRPLNRLFSNDWAHISLLPRPNPSRNTEPNPVSLTCTVCTISIMGAALWGSCSLDMGMPLPSISCNGSFLTPERNYRSSGGMAPPRRNATACQRYNRHDWGFG